MADDVSQGPDRDEISQEPDRDGRAPLVPHWLTVTAVAGLVVAAAVLTVTRSWGHVGATAPGASPVPHASSVPHTPTVSPAPLPPGSAPVAPAPFVAAGTILLTCESVSPRPLTPGWRAGSLRIGTLWLVGGRRLGYVHHAAGGSAGAGSAGGDGDGDGGRSLDVDMMVHVDGGATVVMRAAAVEVLTSVSARPVWLRFTAPR